MLDLNNKSILITGRTGSFGQAFTRTILTRYPNVKRLVILSRDEQRHFDMEMEFSESKYPALGYFTANASIYKTYLENYIHNWLKRESL